jgi:hypothetical protein
MKPLVDFDETYYKEWLQCVDVHIARGMLFSKFFEGVMIH